MLGHEPGDPADPRAATRRGPQASAFPLHPFGVVRLVQQAGGTRHEHQPDLGRYRLRQSQERHVESDAQHGIPLPHNAFPQNTRGFPGKVAEIRQSPESISAAGAVPDRMNLGPAQHRPGLGVPLRVVLGACRVQPDRQYNQAHLWRQHLGQHAQERAVGRARAGPAPEVPVVHRHGHGRSHPIMVAKDAAGKKLTATPRRAAAATR